MKFSSMLKRLKDRAKELKKQVLALYLAYKKRETPLIAKVVAVIIVAYALSPVDLIPDFIPVLGYLDDLILIPMGITFALKLIPASIMEECMKEAGEKLGRNVPEAKIAGAVIIFLWLIIVGVIVWRIWHEINI